MAGSTVRRALLLAVSLLAVGALLYAHVHLHHAQATAAASQQQDLRLGLASAGAVGRRWAHHLGHLTPRRALRQQVITIFPNNNIGTTTQAVQRPVGVKATLLQHFLNKFNGYGAAPTTPPYYAPAVQPYYLPSIGQQNQAVFG